MSVDRFAWFDSPWELTESILAGRSGIDVPRLYVTNLADAEEFLECYGYDWNRADHRREMAALRDEAIEFLEADLMHDEPGLVFDAEVRGERDIRHLLLWASGSLDDRRQLWACTLLRVMHTFAHAGSYYQEQYETQIRRQILDKFEPHIRQTPDGLVLGDGEESIPLVDFTVRERKSRRSIAMKLLHKAENVATDIYDWVGLRFVTRDRFDAFLVARYLRLRNMVMFANTRPGRSRNSLLRLDRIKEDLRELDALVRAGEVQREDRLEWMRRRVAAHDFPEHDSTANPNTATGYHSLQFTCSQLVRVEKPNLSTTARVFSASPGADRLRGIFDRFGVETEARFFFPYEIQILDAENWERSRSGIASHADYKARQRHAVKRRLWGNLVAASPRDSQVRGHYPVATELESSEPVPGR